MIKLMSKVGLVGLFVLIMGVVQSSRASGAWVQKVEPLLWQTACPRGCVGAVSSQTSTEFIVTLTEQADISAASTLSTKLEKGTYLYEQLTAVALQTQPAVIADLQALGAEYRPFWINNMIWVRGNADVIAAMAQRPDVAHIYNNPAVKLDEAETAPAPSRGQAGSLFSPPVIQSSQAVEWNVSLISAPSVWALGIDGTGIVIGGQDTGYNWAHDALKNQYRGWDGVVADHDYNWHDAIKTGGNAVCGSNSPEPCDDIGSSHGTHTMGIMVGDDGNGNQIGIAPGAKWIGCRNMNNGVGTPATYAECYEWFVAPYPIGGNPMTDGDPSKSPHVINNSWSCPVSEGCTDPDVLLTVVDTVRAAGIVTVHAAGNGGFSGCETVNTAAAIYDSSFTVGNTTSSDTINGSSSRGPVTVDGSNRMKPDISAPGTGIRSSVGSTNGYASLTGTSMAAPHVAALVALIIDNDPSLAGQVDLIEQIIRQTAVSKSTSQGCGSDTSSSIPNNVYGYGRINALAAISQTFPFHYYLPVVQTP